MKNNWVRLIAGALASVVLVGAIALTGGMKKGIRTEGVASAPPACCIRPAGSIPTRSCCSSTGRP